MTVNSNYCSGFIYNNPVGSKIEKSNVSSPIGFGQGVEKPQATELASKELAYASKATAMAQIMIGSNLKYNSTAEEYVNQLIKKGKVPNKDFIVEKKAECTSVTELNADGKKIKEVRLENKDDRVGATCIFYNPENQVKYKAVQLTPYGEFAISLDDPKTGEPLIDELYRSDGSLKSNAYYKKLPEGQTSINGKYDIYGIEPSPEDS
jgi:hypothetical protein